MPEDDRVGAGKAPRHPRGPALRGPGVVDDAQPQAGKLELVRRRERARERRLVDVAVDGRDVRAEILQHGEHRGCREVSGVDDEVGP